MAILNHFREYQPNNPKKVIVAFFFIIVIVFSSSSFIRNNYSINEVLTQFYKYFLFDYCHLLQLQKII